MNMITRWDIRPGQWYASADGSPGTLTVLDTDMYAHCDDVVVCDSASGAIRRMDAFKLAAVRYYCIWRDPVDHLVSAPD